MLLIIEFMTYLNSVITGTGSYIPEVTIKNTDFLQHEFYHPNKTRIESANSEIIEKFRDITGIEERRWAEEGILASDMAAEAAEKAILSAGINRDELDHIILAHNFGDHGKHSVQSEMVPSLASRVKHKLGIKNNNCIPFDIIFGCPGWLQGIILADTFVQAGKSKKCLIVGTETLSRVIDTSDRDSMIYADGAGACILEAKEMDHKTGVLSTAAQSFTEEEIAFLNHGTTYNNDVTEDTRYIKMDGRKIYEFALKNVPQAMKSCMEKANVTINEIKKILIHQANEKMDDAIISRFYRLFAIKTPPSFITPMTIRFLGNSSVATVPTLLDMVLGNRLENHSINKGDVILFASVGAGMNINSVTYKF
jgi:3-oxoacyl-[acyl-carrier-protein] synthase-3